MSQYIRNSTLSVVKDSILSTLESTVSTATASIFSKIDVVESTVGSNTTSIITELTSTTVSTLESISTELSGLNATELSSFSTLNSEVSSILEEHSTAFSTLDSQLSQLSDLGGSSSFSVMDYYAGVSPLVDSVLNPVTKTLNLNDYNRNNQSYVLGNITESSGVWSGLVASAVIFPGYYNLPSESITGFHWSLESFKIIGSYSITPTFEDSFSGGSLVVSWELVQEGSSIVGNNSSVPIEDDVSHVVDLNIANAVHNLGSTSSSSLSAVLNIYLEAVPNSPEDTITGVTIRSSSINSISYLVKVGMWV